MRGSLAVLSWSCKPLGPRLSTNLSTRSGPHPYCEGQQRREGAYEARDEQREGPKAREAAQREKRWAFRKGVRHRAGRGGGGTYDRP